MYKLMLLALALACDAGEQPANTPTPTPPAAQAPAAEAPAADDAAEAAQGDSGEAAVNAEDGGGAAANADEAAAADHAGLAKADAADGTVDHVVSQCAGCGLAMAGDAAHSIEAHGYTMHMCSPGCKEKYQGDLEGNLAQLAQ